MFISQVVKLCALPAMLVFLASCGGGGGGPGGPTWVETDVKVADIDGDGRADVLTIAMRSENGQEQGYLTLYRQTVPGTFAEPLATVVGAYPWRMAVADINGDGAPDLVITDPGADVTWLLLQDPTDRGRFLPPQALISGLNSYSVVIADLNNDGVLDVAVPGSTNTSRAITVRYQNPAQRGSFGPPMIVGLPAAPSQLAAGDVDGDGLTDLLAYAYTGGGNATSDPIAGLVVLFQQTDGGFVDSGVLASQVGLNCDRVVIADVNGDGRPDLLAALTPWSERFTGQILVVPQTSARTFGPSLTTPLTGKWLLPNSTFADLNQDGTADATVAGYWFEDINVWAGADVLLNDGSGRFALSAHFEVPIAVSTLTAGDLDGDGRNDLVLYGDGQVMVMYQSTTPGVFLAPRSLR
jgi:FG-GAP-like repeat/FG-GAP repeat